MQLYNNKYFTLITINQLQSINFYFMTYPHLKTFRNQFGHMSILFPLSSILSLSYITQYLQVYIQPPR